MLLSPEWRGKRRCANGASGSIFPSWSVRFPRRGPQRLPPLVARCDQPFGLLSSGREISPELDLLVLPAIGSVKKALYTRLRAIGFTEAEAWACSPGWALWLTAGAEEAAGRRPAIMSPEDEAAMQKAGVR